MATGRQTDDSRPAVSGQEFLLDDPGFLQGIVRRLLQELLEAEMDDHLGAGRYERVSSRCGYRSGHRPRKLRSRLGELELAVPTERSGRYRTRLFERYQRSEQAFLLTLQEMYLQGVSTRRLAEVVAEWRPRYPAVADKLEAEIEDTLAFYGFPAAHWLRIRTTNMLERYNGELRRRTTVIRVFPNAASCLRLISAHTQEQAAEWAAQTQYLDMSLLQP